MKIYAILILGFAFVFTAKDTNGLEFAGQIAKNFFWDIPEPNRQRYDRNTMLEICRRNGLSLASIKDPIDQRLIDTIQVGKTINGNQGYNFFLSGNDEAKEGNWTWGDGTPFKFSFWNQAWDVNPRPNNREMNCMFASATYWAGGGNWFNDRCDKADFSTLCEGKRVVVGVVQTPTGLPNMG